MIQTAAILCPGPSLPTFPGRAGLDAVIGVNRAVGAFECDYWVFSDAEVPQIAQPLGRPTIVCDRHLVRGFRNSPLAQHPYIDREAAGPIANYPIRWCRYSATSALVLAFGLGAKEIRCWGIDRQGVTDWDGTLPPGARRTEDRWREEASIWSQVVDHLAAAGVSVTLAQEQLSEQEFIDQATAAGKKKKKQPQ